MITWPVNNNRSLPGILFFGALCLFVFSGCISSSYAQQPTQQQLDQFQRLSPAEQNRLAKLYGIDIPQVGALSTNSVIQTNSVEPRITNEVEMEDYSEYQRYLDYLSKLELEEKANSLSLALDELTPFGYELFAGNPTSFTPVNDVPVSSNYVLGPGDTLNVNLYGKKSGAYELAIDQEGAVNLPELGPLVLAGLSFAEAKEAISATIKKKVIGTNASVSMGTLRSIRVFVLGEAYLPGSYVVSSLSTITNALVLSGGVSKNGSLRKIQLKRRGQLIQTFDLYDLLLKGDTSNDAQLQSGDVVFIPPVGATVGIQGEVRRPARYELIGEETVGGLIGYSGGLLPSAQPQTVTLERVDIENKRILLNVDVNSQAGLNATLINGDVVAVPKLLEQVENIVRVTGYVQREEKTKWREGLYLTDVVPSVKSLKKNPDLHYGLIKRYLPPSQKLEVLSFDFEKALSSPGSIHDVLLMPQDEILFFALYEDDELLELLEQEEATPLAYAKANAPKFFEEEKDEQKEGGDVEEYDSIRQAEVAAIIDQLRRQSTITEPSREVSIVGDVKYPGEYPLVEGMTVEGLIYAAGGLTEKAFQIASELSRTEFDTYQERKQYRVTLNLTQQDSLGYKLKSRDQLQIKTIPAWAESEHVTLRGEVKFPGTYPIYKDDTLATLVERAGGLTEFAYAPGAIFTRETLRKQQEQQLKEMQERLAEDIAKSDLVAANQTGGQAKGAGQAQRVLAQLENTKATGRLVIDLEKVLRADSDYSIPLQKGDTLYIPTKKNSVTIVGEVQLPISQIFEPGLEYWDYIERSGGTTDKADEERVYIIKANGGVEIPESSGWFASNEHQISPGDTIVVPLDADKLDQIELWRDMSQIFYQIALGAAAVGSL